MMLDFDWTEIVAGVGALLFVLDVFLLEMVTLGVLGFVLMTAGLLFHDFSRFKGKRKV